MTGSSLTFRIEHFTCVGLQRLLVCLAFACAVFTVVATTKAVGETRVALVIGNGAYARDPLANPARDAALITETLRRVGFDIIHVQDADRKAMQDAITRFGRKLAAPDSVGLFYYAGHGVQVDGENFLLPIDVDIRAETEVRIQGVNLKEILITLRAAKSRLGIAILDACRNNPFVGLTRGLRRGLAAVQAPAGTLIAFSTAPGEVALDGSNGNSPYTAALAKAIPAPNTTIETVFKRTRQSVMKATNRTQVPWEHSSLVGDFRFVPSPMPGVNSAGQNTVSATAPAVQSERLAEVAAWEKATAAGTRDAYTRFLKSYPTGAFSELARLKLTQLDRWNNWQWWLPHVVATGSPVRPARTDAEHLYERALKLEAEQTNAQDAAHALALFRAAAEKGLVPAMHRYAQLIHRRRDKKPNAGGPAPAKAMAQAIEWYEKAAQRRHAPSLVALGKIYEFGEGTSRDLPRALQLYKSAAAAGDGEGMASVGFLYNTGKGVARDQRRARKWYSDAAKAGSKRAMFNLAIMLMSGEGGDVDLPRAIDWLQQAAAAGHPPAMRQLAALFDQGRGVRRDPEQAAQYLLLAYRGGDKAAREDLFRHNRRWSRATRRAVQRRLSSKGLYTGADHGVINQRTKQALMAFQKQG